MEASQVNTGRLWRRWQRGNTHSSESGLKEGTSHLGSDDEPEVPEGHLGKGVEEEAGHWGVGQSY